MSGLALTFGFEDDALRGHLGRLAVRDAARFKAVNREIGEYFLGQVQDNLDKQRLADGSAMPPSAAAAKRNGKTLIDTHRLYDSYVYQLTGLGVEVGSAAVYAAIHHFGGKAGRGLKTTIKARPVLGLRAKDEQHIGRFVLDQLKGLQ